MRLFDKPGREHTKETVRIALEKAKELGAKVVLATNAGDTAVEALEQAKALGIVQQLVVVGSVYDYKTAKHGNKMDEEKQGALQESGVPIVFASHVLSGVERGLSTKFSGIYPAELMAHTLRMFGQGVKVCVECAIMAYDAGLLGPAAPVVCVGGTGKGADTACLITPAHANDVLSLRVHEIYCKPSLL